MLRPVDRHRFRFGPYATPRFRYGQRVECEVRGEVVLVAMKDSPISWPLAHLPGKSSRGLVVYKGLAKALRHESAVAICHHWGVHPTRVSKWRDALGIGRDTPGHHELNRETGKQKFPKLKAKFWAKQHDPKRAAKIAAAKRGKPRPPHVIEAMRAANVGRKQSAAERRMRSEAQKQRYAERPRPDQWTAAEDAIVRSHSTDDAAKLTGRTVSAVRNRRHDLGVPDGRRR